MAKDNSITVEDLEKEIDELGASLRGKIQTELGKFKIKTGISVRGINITLEGLRPVSSRRRTYILQSVDIDVDIRGT